MGEYKLRNNNLKSIYLYTEIIDHIYKIVVQQQRHLSTFVFDVAIREFVISVKLIRMK